MSANDIHRTGAILDYGRFLDRAVTILPGQLIFHAMLAWRQQGCSATLWMCLAVGQGIASPAVVFLESGQDPSCVLQSSSSSSTFGLAGL